MEIKRSLQEVVWAHGATGKYTTVYNYKIFYIDEGTGVAVFCIHGVPTSTFLYRKVVSKIARRGMGAVDLDRPVPGSSERPKDFEYLFSNLCAGVPVAA